MSLEVVTLAIVALQTVAVVLLALQVHHLKRALAVKHAARGSVPELLVVNALNRIDHRLDVLEEQQTRTDRAPAPRRSVEIPAAQMTTLRSPSNQTSASPYELAQHLAREGSDVDQLMARCGLSRHEAELVLRLYAKRA
ncbi:DUF2802 domain-containing protein [Dyella monticola]|uniref:DUF2802 domain-containing protein n=1 Tax=Dyella monticola TaxID=1927958 RepID=A0A370X0Y4_9GAMM|nr:DUF2802 domain-containing protein [Dyella monticola]RDS82064.1 DUF2802 domain-containing protein [Dyella monticola]